MGGKCTTAADVYSLGVVLWELATQERPARGQMRDIECVLLASLPPVRCTSCLTFLLLLLQEPGRRPRRCCCTHIQVHGWHASSPPHSEGGRPDAGGPQRQRKQPVAGWHVSGAPLHLQPASSTALGHLEFSNCVCHGPWHAGQDPVCKEPPCHRLRLTTWTRQPVCCRRSCLPSLVKTMQQQGSCHADLGTAVLRADGLGHQRPP